MPLLHPSAKTVLDNLLHRNEVAELVAAFVRPESSPVVAVGSNVVDAVIRTLRKKLGADTIRNVRGVGWQVSAPGTEK